MASNQRMELTALRAAAHTPRWTDETRRTRVEVLSARPRMARDKPLR